VQKAVRHMVVPVRFGEEEVEAMQKYMDKIGTPSRSEFIREAVKHYLDTVSEMKIINIRAISKGQAKEEILGYLRNKREAETFDIANDLRLDLNLTMQALKELWEEGDVS